MSSLPPMAGYNLNADSSHSQLGQSRDPPNIIIAPSEVQPASTVSSSASESSTSILLCADCCPAVNLSGDGMCDLRMASLSLFSPETASIPAATSPGRVMSDVFDEFGSGFLILTGDV